jgi:hypothetical protein
MGKLYAPFRWLRGRQGMLFSAIVISAASVTLTAVHLVARETIDYKPTTPLAIACFLVTLLLLVATGITLIDRIFSAWYHNRSPEVWERIIWLVVLLAIPWGILLYYWLVYRRLDENGQWREFKA